MNQFLSLISITMYPLYSSVTGPGDFCPAYGKSLLAEFTVIVTCDYVGDVTTLRAPRYSLTLSNPHLASGPSA